MCAQVVHGWALEPRDALGYGFALPRAIPVTQNRCYTCCCTSQIVSVTGIARCRRQEGQLWAHVHWHDTAEFEEEHIAETILDDVEEPTRQSGGIVECVECVKNVWLLRRVGLGGVRGVDYKPTSHFFPNGSQNLLCDGLGADVRQPLEPKRTHGEASSHHSGNHGPTMADRAPIRLTALLHDLFRIRNQRYARQNDVPTKQLATGLYFVAVLTPPRITYRMQHTNQTGGFLVAAPPRLEESSRWAPTGRTTRMHEQSPARAAPS